MTRPVRTSQQRGKWQASSEPSGRRGQLRRSPPLWLTRTPGAGRAPPLESGCSLAAWRSVAGLGASRERAALRVCPRRFAGCVGARCGGGARRVHGSDVSVSLGAAHGSQVEAAGVPLTHGADAEPGNIALCLSPSRFPNS